MPEPSENWLTVGTIVGMILAGIVVGFMRSYQSERSRERSSAERSPEVAAGAIGAAFVDRSAANSLTSIQGHVEGIHELLRERAEHEHDDRLKRSILDEIDARLSNKE